MFKKLKSLFVKENPQKVWDDIASHYTIDYDKMLINEKERGREEGIKQGKTEGIQQGKVEGLKEGELSNQRGITINLFKRRYPTQDSSFLDRLTFQQYQTIYDMLLDEKSIDEIHNALQFA